MFSWSEWTKQVIDLTKPASMRQWRLEARQIAADRYVHHSSLAPEYQAKARDFLSRLIDATNA